MDSRRPLTGDTSASQASTPIIAWLPILAAALYVLLALLHAHQSGATKHSYMLAVVLGCLAGAACNCLRIYAQNTPLHGAGAVAQQLLSLAAPQLLAVVQYFIFSRMLELFGPEVVMLCARPKVILVLLLALEGAALALQTAAVGLGAHALTATATATGEMGRGGGMRVAALLIAGLATQLLACLLFLCFLFFFLVATPRLRDSAAEHYPFYTTRLRLFTAALAPGNLLLALSCVFRIFQTSMGSGAKVDGVDWYSYAFGELPLFLCVLLLGVFHPGHVLPLKHSEAVAAAREVREILSEGMLLPPPRGVSRAASSFHCRAAGRVPLSPLSPTVTWREATKGHRGMHSRNVSSPDSATTIVDADLEERGMTYLEFLSGERGSQKGRGDPTGMA